MLRRTTMILVLGVFLVAGLDSPYRVIGAGGDPDVKIYFYHLDHLGTPSVITDENGYLVEKHKYLPFGEELGALQSVNSHQFTGHERDGETGLDYMLARYYSSGGIFRFMSVDPVFTPRRNLFEPQRWNPYSYSANNPIKFIDPDGKDAVISGNVNSTPPSVTMTVNIRLEGSGASADTAAQFEQQASTSLSEKKTFMVEGGAGEHLGLKDGTEVELSIKVNVSADPDFQAENVLTVTDSGETKIDLSGDTGTLNSSDLSDPDRPGVAAHEAAHLAGLTHDSSSSGVANPSGKNTTVTEKETAELGNNALKESKRQGEK